MLVFFFIGMFFISDKSSVIKTKSALERTDANIKWLWEAFENYYHTDDGRIFSFAKLPFLIPIYSIIGGRIILKTSRQSTKTTYLKNKLINICSSEQGMSALYAAPTFNQVKDFSRKKHDAEFLYNKHLARKVQKGLHSWNIELKEYFVNGGFSTLTLRTAGDGGESIRGGTYNIIAKDEYQSFQTETIPIIDECAATFAGDNPIKAFFINTGTPLSFNNPIESEWSRSLQYEWIIKCPHCKKWQDPIGFQHLRQDRDFLVCQYCSCSLYKTSVGRTVLDGRWVATNPSGLFPGFRLVRPMMPWAEFKNKNSTGIIDRLSQYSDMRFSNEVMGLPYDSGRFPITEEDLKKICISDFDLPVSYEDMMSVSEKYWQYEKFAGIDWAMESNDGTPAYTKIGIFALVGKALRLIFAHSFVGQGSGDPEVVLADMIKWIRLFNVTCVGADYGVGYFENLRLKSVFPEKVFILHYIGSMGKTESRYDEVSQKYMIHRTQSMNNLMSGIKGGHFELPSYNSCKEHVIDWTRVYMEVSESTRTVVWRRTGTDDFWHVANYAYIASKMYQSPLEYRDKHLPEDTESVWNDQNIGV